MNRNISALIIFSLLMFSLLYSEFYVQVEAEQEDPEVQRKVDEAMIKVDQAMQEVEKKTQIMSFQYSSDTPKLGVYLSNLDFEDAYEMHYNYNYGVLISGITSGGPAQKSGLLDGDIIMEFEGSKARFESQLVRMIKSKKVGDNVTIKFFRDGNIYETNLILDTLQKSSLSEDETTGFTKKRRLDVGNGGGSWYPIWYRPDVKDFNQILSDFGFKDETFSENGFLIHGGGGQGNIGKGWFIGGMGTGYSNTESTKHNWVHFNNGSEDSTMVTRKAEYSVGFGGVTLDKRLALSSKLISSVGFMIGWGGQEYKITQRDSNGDLPNFDFENLPSDQFDEYYDYAAKLKLSEDYILFQPKIMLMYRILDWLAFRTEVGYLVSYSSEGWKAKWNGESVKIENGPETNMDGLTLTIGPWLGF